MTAAGPAVGDVILDSYANPAVVFAVAAGRIITICQCAGSDRGRITTPPAHITPVTDPDRAEWARAIARTYWSRR